jgi:hypothetical protein
MTNADKRPAPTRPASNQPAAPPVQERPVTYHDAAREEDEFEGLLREKDDFQEAVEADLRGEKPKEPGGSPMP